MVLSTACFNTSRLYKGRSLADVQRCPRLQKSRLLLDEVAQHFCISGVASSMKNEELEAEWKSLIKMVWEFRDDTVDVEVPDEGEEGEEESGEEKGVAGRRRGRTSRIRSCD